MKRTRYQIRKIAKIYAASVLANIFDGKATLDLFIGDSILFDEEDLEIFSEELRAIADKIHTEPKFHELDDIIKFVDEGNATKP